MILVISCLSGTEACVKRELIKLGIEDAKAFDSKFEIEGDYEVLAKLCVWLRCADRVFIELAKFRVTTFDELFEKVSEIDFSAYLKPYTRVMLDGTCAKSKLMAIKASGGIIKKAIMNNLNSNYGISNEVGVTIYVYFTILDDICTIYLDACGDGLHKRGYRKLNYSAPLKETLACSLIDLSIFSPQKTLTDVFCGSGTIAIEAAMIARNIAPGLNRHFDFEKFKNYPAKLLENVKNLAKQQEINILPNIYASDIDPNAIEIAKINAKNAGVEKYIKFSVLDMKDFTSNEEYGIIISNPPYGDRLMNKNQAVSLYRNFAKMFEKLNNWSCYILTDFDNFEKIINKTATKKRKLYNARIKCTYYSFLGKKPVKK